MITKLLVDGEEKLYFRKLVNVVNSLEFLNEFAGEEREYLIRKCIDRVLEAEESFAEYLRFL